MLGRVERIARAIAALRHYGTRDLADAWLCRPLASRPRPPRYNTGIEDLPKRSALVVVAHPDDDVAAAGVLLARAPQVGVIYTTDGAPRRGPDAAEAGFTSWPAYASARWREVESALALLGRDISPLHSLGIADKEATFDLVDASRYLVEQIRSGVDYVVTHPYEGGHPDHDATAFCVHAACALIAKAGGKPPPIVEARFYAAFDGSYVFSKFVPQDDAGPSFALDLTAAEIDLKRRMCALHATQQKHIVQFRLDEEVFRLAPRYHFSAPPEPTDVGFNQFNWPLTGKIWRIHARRAMRELDLLEELA